MIRSLQADGILTVTTIQHDALGDIKSVKKNEGV